MGPVDFKHHYFSWNYPSKSDSQAWKQGGVSGRRLASWVGWSRDEWHRVKSQRETDSGLDKWEDGPKEPGSPVPPGSAVVTGACRGVGAPRALLPPTFILQHPTRAWLTATLPWHIAQHGSTCVEVFNLMLHIPFQCFISLPPAALCNWSSTPAPHLYHPSTSPFPWPRPCTALALSCL